MADGVFLEVQDLTDEELINTDFTGSLADLMGFPKKPIKLGQVSEENIVHEAVVAIPFIEKEGKKEFFNISREVINSAFVISKDQEPSTRVEPAGRSVVDMIEAMRRYVLPPKFDFITNKTVKPLVMYIFEFEYKLKKKDLVDIWQNLSPEIGRKFETKSVIVTHKLLQNELMGGEFKDSLRWMVFKVKQKAANNYFKMLSDSIKEEGFEFESLKGSSVAIDRADFNYSHNWPYDFFSLVELVKMDAEIIIENKTDEE